MATAPPNGTVDLILYILDELLLAVANER